MMHISSTGKLLNKTNLCKIGIHKYDKERVLFYSNHEPPSLIIYKTCKFCGENKLLNFLSVKQIEIVE